MVKTSYHKPTGLCLTYDEKQKYKNNIVTYQQLLKKRNLKDLQNQSQSSWSISSIQSTQ